MQDDSPERKGEEAPGGAQVAAAAGAPAGVRGVASSAGAEQEDESDSPWDSEDDSPERKGEEAPGGAQVAAAAGAPAGVRGVASSAGAEQEDESDSPWDSEDDSPERKGEEAPGGAQVAAAAGAPAGVRGVASSAGAEQEDESDSPWDSESLRSLTACQSPEAAVNLQVSAKEGGEREGREAAATQTDFQCDGQAMAAELPAEVAEAPGKQLLPEGSLEVPKVSCGELQGDKLRLQEELARVKAKLQALEEQHVQAERCVQDLKTALAEKQREATASSRQLQDLLEASLGGVSLKDLEERVGRLELENARLEDTGQQQAARLEALQKELHASASRESGRKPGKELAEWKQPAEARLEEEMKKNVALQKECNRSKRLLEKAMKKVRAYERRARESQMNFPGEREDPCSGRGREVAKLRTKVRELCCSLEAERRKSRQLEKANEGAREELAWLHGSRDKLRKSKRQLEEEVVALRCRLEAKMRDQRHREEDKREIEQKAGQELRQKLQEVNLFLQTQAAAQDRAEQLRAASAASAVGRLQQRVRHLEYELALTKRLQ
ncbi:ankyrin repeat domain-containing protein 26-like [Struthio camelus]|uniref:ankyrin repeat domain-containing protein 26-like n=4 Tax=Struthio camelus TaxID=8801 RepID=UPI003603B343